MNHPLYTSLYFWGGWPLGGNLYHPNNSSVRLAVPICFSPQARSIQFRAVLQRECMPIDVLPRWLMRPRIVVVGIT